MSVMVVGVGDAAKRLGLGEHRVRSLINAGLLNATRVSGRYVVDENSLEALASTERRSNVRSFSRRIAWAAAALMDGMRPEWITQSEMSRLRARLDHLDADRGAWTARMRWRSELVATYRAGQDQLNSLLTDARVARSGSAAGNIASDRQVGADRLDLWIPDWAALRSVEADFGLLTSTSGNVCIRVAEVDGLNALGDDGDAYRLIVAADLLDADDARGRDAGEHLLQVTLGERRWRQLPK